MSPRNAQEVLASSSVPVLEDEERLILKEDAGGLDIRPDLAEDAIRVEQVGGRRREGLEWSNELNGRRGWAAKASEEKGHDGWMTSESKGMRARGKRSGRRRGGPG